MLANYPFVWLQRVASTVLLTLGLNTHVLADDRVIRVAFLTADPVQIEALDLWSKRFEIANPGYVLDVRAYSDASFKRDLKFWLDNGQFDVIHWQAGRRLTDLIEQQYLTSMEEILEADFMATHLPANILEQVQTDNKVFAVPFAQYLWGFYYNKDLFKALELTPPETWADFLTICSTLKSNGIAPLVQPNIEGWETQGWLDFITMMIGGAPLRQALVSRQPLSQTMSDNVIQTFGFLVDNGYFFSGANEWRWQQAFPIIGRELAGMTLTGQFAEKFISPEITHKIGFFPFPDSVNNGTVAPLDVFIVPKGTENSDNIAVLFEFLMRPDVASKFALDLGWLPVDLVNYTSFASDERIDVAVDHLINARTIRQYFDRDAEQAYAKQVHSAIRSAIATGDSDYLLSIMQQ
ncbi:extracellular solute-binding protein [Alteromonas sp. ASW11-36]|uniref:Extracellular solute-binding protein n=1 Tax=Alteromonas arenosi TaxID=3055817 RepID=A0ABT7T009_9ALTE|nr:extracellular solute-binding protein [Alteromonas sp. ASW11-36]MDM7861778.1 extracellular solute-binding protein [Alteromonas sp. ASW11-36]